MAGKIFISYRRVDTEGYAGRIYDRLRIHFSDNEIFMDVDDIEPGEDFVLALQSAVSDCDVLIALIGRQWLNVKDQEGDRRLNNPNDFVRLEIATALRRDIRVIPVLLGGTAMPRQRDLPDDLKPLSRRNALAIRHDSFGADIGKLQRAIEKCLDTPGPAIEATSSPTAETKTEKPAQKKPTVPFPKLKFNLSASPNPVDTETEVTWTVEFQNQGKVAVTDMTLIHQRTILADEFDLAPGEQREFSFQRIYEEMGERSEKVSLFGSGIHEEARGFLIVEQPPSFDLQLLPDPKKAEPGQRVTWTVSIVNDGGADLHQVMARRGRKLLEDPFDLPRGDQRQVAYFLTGKEEGTQTEKVTVTSMTEAGERLRRQAEASVKVAHANQMTITEPLEMALVRIPAGEFVMGEGQEQHQLNLPEFFIGKTAVTNDQYRVFVEAIQHRSPRHWEGGKIPSGKENHPVVRVSWHDAIAFCQWLSEQIGKDVRLPSEAEWEKAARGTDGRAYPWGDEWDQNKCNTKESGFGDTTPVGQFSPAGDSPYGCVDMAGNVCEWTRSIYQDYPYDPDDGRENLDSNDRRVLRGGSWRDYRRNARCACRRGSDPDLRLVNFGFRVVVFA